MLTETTILLIDDEPAERRLLYHALKNDHRVLEAQDAPSALETLNRDSVDLVVLDLHLPPDLGTPEEGIRLAAQMRDRYPQLPVVVLTANDDHHLARQLGERGVAGYLNKPVDPSTLRHVIARAANPPGSGEER